MRGKFILIALVILTLSNITLAASITGIIYDESLNQVDRTVIEISPPLQRDITQSARYYFEVPPGTYTIHAYSVTGGIKQSTTETITIVEGDQFYDLFLTKDSNKRNIYSKVANNEMLYFYLGAIFVLLLIGIYTLLKLRKKKAPDTIKEIKDIQPEIEEIIKEESPSELKSEEPKQDSNKSFKDKIIKFLEQNKGEITQKQLRKEIPYSEAKISLLITELEKEGKIKKVKKGRINTLVLKQNKIK